MTTTTQMSQHLWFCVNYIPIQHVQAQYQATFTLYNFYIYIFKYHTTKTPLNDAIYTTILYMHLFLCHTSGHIHTHCKIMGMAVCSKVCVYTISTRLSLCSFRPWLKINSCVAWPLRHACTSWSTVSKYLRSVIKYPQQLQGRSLKLRTRYWDQLL